MACPALFSRRLWEGRMGPTQKTAARRLETLQLFLFLFPLQHVKSPALQDKWIAVLRMAFRTRKVFGTLEKRRPAPI